MVALAGLAVVLGFVLGWLAHRRLSLHYKERWLQAIGMLNSKALESADANVVVPLQGSQREIGEFDRFAPSRPYVAGKWALDEREEGMGTVVFYAIRNGFDDVLLGNASNSKRYPGVYRMNRANAEQAVAEMNGRTH